MTFCPAIARNRLPVWVAVAICLWSGSANFATASCGDYVYINGRSVHLHAAGSMATDNLRLFFHAEPAAYGAVFSSLLSSTGDGLRPSPFQSEPLRTACSNGQCGRQELPLAPAPKLVVPPSDRCCLPTFDDVLAAGSAQVSWIPADAATVMSLHLSSGQFRPPR